MDRFFIAGCQRSGTTLLRLIMDSHSAVHCYDEIDGYKLLTLGKPEDLMKQCLNKLVGFKIPRFTEQLLWPSMSDIDYGEFPNFYHGEPVLFLVRDYRDVVRSMLQLHYPDGESWMFKYGKRILKHQSENPQFAAEDRKSLEKIKASGFREHLTGALYWKYKTDALFSMYDAGMTIIPVTYERLVENPRFELLKVIEFLGLPWEESILKHNEQLHSELDSNGMAIGNTNPKLPIHKNSLKLFKNFFSLNEINEMYEVVCETLTRLSFLNITFYQ
jgi:hypothetical protein